MYMMYLVRPVQNVDFRTLIIVKQTAAIQL